MRSEIRWVSQSWHGIWILFCVCQESIVGVGEGRVKYLQIIHLIRNLQFENIRNSYDSNKNTNNPSKNCAEDLTE